MARTQKNKATNYHLGTLKPKLAKLRNELLIEQGGGGGGGGELLGMLLYEWQYYSNAHISFNRYILS